MHGLCFGERRADTISDKSVMIDDGRKREEPMLKISMLGISTSSHVIGLSMDLGIIPNMFENPKLEAWSAEHL